MGMGNNGGNLYQYFMPVGTGALGQENLAAAAADHGELVCVVPCTLRRIQFHIDLAIDATTTAPVVTFTHRDTIGGSTDTAIDTLTLADNAVVGSTYYTDVNQEFAVGEVLLLDHTTQAAGSGTAAGTGYYSGVCEDSPEAAGNNANLIASA